MHQSKQLANIMKIVKVHSSIAQFQVPLKVLKAPKITPN